MTLEDLNPAVRAEEILDGADIEPATRLEYFMKKAANEVPKPTGSSDAGKVVTVNDAGSAYELKTPESGSDLPTYASTDIGKILTLVEDMEHGEQVTVVSEQTATKTGQNITTGLTSAEAVALCDAQSAVSFYLDGNNYNRNFGYYDFGHGSEPCIKMDTGPGEYVAIVFLFDNSGKVRYTGNGSHTVAASMFSPGAKMSWQKPVLPDPPAANGNYQLTITGGVASWTAIV